MGKIHGFWQTYSLIRLPVSGKLGLKTLKTILNRKPSSTTVVTEQNINQLMVTTYGDFPEKWLRLGMALSTRLLWIKQ